MLSKPAGTLTGHGAAISQILVHQEEAHIISISDDKVIKIWSARTMTCLQTIVDKDPHRPENYISAAFFDVNMRRVLTASSRIDAWPLLSKVRASVTRSHEAPVTAAMFNHNFHQVVSGCQNGTICLWELSSGETIFSFSNLHGVKGEITAMCFDHSGRRMVSGGRDGVLKMWNFNNGATLKQMIKDNSNEVTDVIYVNLEPNRYIVAVGWDRKIAIYLDDPDESEADPIRVLPGPYSGAEKDLCVIALTLKN